MNHEEFEKRHNALFDLIFGIFKFYWIIWIVGAILSLGFLGVVVYVLLKLASHL